MKNENGLTLIELMILIAILGIVLSLAQAGFDAYKSNVPSVTLTSQTTCVNGYLFASTSSGSPIQVMDNGTAVKC